MFRNLKQSGWEGAFFSMEKGTGWDEWIKTYHKISVSSIRHVTSHCCAEELLWPQILLSSTEQMFLVWKVGLQSRQHCCSGQPGVSETRSSQGKFTSKLTQTIRMSFSLDLPVSAFPVLGWEMKVLHQSQSVLKFILFYFIFLTRTTARANYKHSVNYTYGKLHTDCHIGHSRDGSCKALI